MSSQSRPERKYTYNNITTNSQRWDGFKPRAGDVIISTPPKCGTTWTQMICALLIFQKPKFERKLTDYTPWLDMAVKPVEEVLATYEAQTHKRFIKTHTPLDGIPYFENVNYLFVARDPRDAFISMGNHFGNMRPEAVARLMKSAQERKAPLRMRAPDVRDAFRDWITASGVPEEGVPTEFNVLHHADTFWQFRHLPNIHLFHYSDMKADLDGQMRHIAAAIGVPVNEAVWPQLVAAAGFAEMKSNAETLAPTAGAGDEWQSKSGFFNKGESGQWRDVLGAEELALYREVMTARLEPELARWLEHGWGG